MPTISTPLYLLLFLVVVVVYWCLPKGRDVFLYLASAAFIATFDWQTTLWLVGFGAFSYVVTQTLGCRYRSLTVIAAVSVGAYLCYYKYAPPIAAQFVPHPGKKSPSVVVPLGASYFTFKLIHYVVESSRKHIPPHTFAQFMSYVFFVPMFFAGPIERFDDFLKNGQSTFSIDLVHRGGTRIVYGLIKKFVILDMVLARREPHTRLVDGIPLLMPSFPTEKLLDAIPHVHPLFVWQYVINGFVGDYFDFAGYSDIAIGFGLLLGVKLGENFEYPFLVSNIGDFWKRYHMSLSNWAQRYVYFPVLGATRNAQLALFATMVTIGLWHAGSLNYLAWGLYQASLLSIHLVWTRYKRRRLAREEEEGGRFERVVESKPFAVAGWAITCMGVCACYAFGSTRTHGIWAGIRVFAALAGIHLKA